VGGVGSFGTTVLCSRVVAGTRFIKRCVCTRFASLCVLCICMVIADGSWRDGMKSTVRDFGLWNETRDYWRARQGRPAARARAYAASAACVAHTPGATPFYLPAALLLSNHCLHQAHSERPRHAARRLLPPLPTTQLVSPCTLGNLMQSFMMDRSRCCMR